MLIYWSIKTGYCDWKWPVQVHLLTSMLYVSLYNCILCFDFKRLVVGQQKYLNVTSTASYQSSFISWSSVLKNPYQCWGSAWVYWIHLFASFWKDGLLCWTVFQILICWVFFLIFLTVSINWRMRFILLLYNINVN